MLIGGVIQHQVQNDADVALVRFSEEVFEIIQRSIFRRDIFIIRNIVAAVPIGRGKMRREPKGIDAEVFEIIQFCRDAFEITNAITVTIRKRARIDLIKNCALPPFEFCHFSSIGLLQKYFFATDLHGFSLIFKKFVQIREICGRKNYKINSYHDLCKSFYVICNLPTAFTQGLVNTSSLCGASGSSLVRSCPGKWRFSCRSSRHLGQSVTS